MLPTINHSLSLPQVGRGHWLTILRQLSRTELSTMVALSGLAGAVFAAEGWQLDALLTTCGIWLLAAGCSALNQWQEQDLDSRMQRTQSRPLPAGKLQPKTALLLSAVAICGGLSLLALLPGKLALLLGVLAVIWYNGIYTPLKRRTPFAALPGAVCGALPPMIGWTGAGQPLLAPEILILAGTLFIWQIPHSWLLLCMHRNDLRLSGLPDLFKTIPTEQLLRINQSWLAGLGICYLFFPLFGLITNLTLIIVFLSCLLLIGCAFISEFKKEAPRIAPKRLFHLTNLSMTLLLVSLLLDNL